ncbi:LOW QUALITY PROTEIN: hypothetical protein PHMEG_00022898, partial [Phytophthora megakarya]
MSASLRTPVSLPVSASTSVSTLVVDPASAPTSASVPASAHVSANTLELKAKQRAGSAKPDSPRTVFDGSSVFSTDGGIPVDYEDGELEDKAPRLPCCMTPSLRLGLAVLVKTIRTLPRRSVREVLVIQLETLAITSKRDATRTDDSVREPWMPSERFIEDRYGAMIPPNEIPLFVDNRIVDDAEADSTHFEPTTNQRRDYYISLFHELRYLSSKKTSGQSRVPEWQALCQCWNQFVANFNTDPAAYRERIASARERFIRVSKTSVIQRVHDGSVNANIPCAVPEGVHCPHCLAGAPASRDLTGYTTNRVTANIKEIRAKLSCTSQYPSVVGEHNTPRNTAPRSVTPPVRGGLRTPSPFPE